MSQVQVSLLEQTEASKEDESMTTQLLPYQGVVVGKGGLEPPPLAGHDPKSCSSASSDTSPRSKSEDIISFCLTLCLTLPNTLCEGDIMLCLTWTQTTRLSP